NSGAFWKSTKARYINNMFDTVQVDTFDLPADHKGMNSYYDNFFICSNLMHIHGEQKDVHPIFVSGYCKCSSKYPNIRVQDLFAQKMNKSTKYTCEKYLTFQTVLPGGKGTIRPIGTNFTRPGGIIIIMPGGTIRPKGTNFTRPEGTTKPGGTIIIIPGGTIRPKETNFT